MRRELVIIFIAIALASCGCISGTSPAASPAPSTTVAATPTSVPAKTIYIDGFVLDQNGTAVPNARVALWQGDQPVTTPESIQYTNTTGYFIFNSLQPAHYQVTADVQQHQGTVDRRFDDSTSIQVKIPGYTVSKATPNPSQGTVTAGKPSFDVVRTGPTSVEVRLTSFGGVRTLKGFYVKSPAITNSEPAAVDQSLGESWTAAITDPALGGTVNFIAYSWVNGQYTKVVDTTI
jgi:hypothetical protein